MQGCRAMLPISRDTAPRGSSGSTESHVRLIRAFAVRGSKTRGRAAFRRPALFVSLAGARKVRTAGSRAARRGPDGTPRGAAGRAVTPRPRRHAPPLPDELPAAVAEQFGHVERAAAELPRLAVDDPAHGLRTDLGDCLALVHDLRAHLLHERDIGHRLRPRLGDGSTEHAVLAHTHLRGPTRVSCRNEPLTASVRGATTS